MLVCPCAHVFAAGLVEITDAVGHVSPRSRPPAVLSERKSRTKPAGIGITRQTLYRHVSPAGELRPDGVKLLSR